MLRDATDEMEHLLDAGASSGGEAEWVRVHLVVRSIADLREPERAEEWLAGEHRKFSAV